MVETEEQEQETAQKETKRKADATARKPRVTTAEFGEPATKEQGKPFDATTAPRQEESRVNDVSRDIQDQATSAPRKRPENNTSGTA